MTKNTNTGSNNTGDFNTGDSNTGDSNTGDRNTGNRNTGNRNAGDFNTGYWNTGSRNTGYCNSITPEDCLIFNKPAKHADWANATKPDWMYCNLTMWVSESDMTSEEKDAFPSYVTTGGYLKAYATLQDAWKESWDNADKVDRDKTFELPNYDRDVFIEVFGFDPEEDKKSCAGKVIEIEGVKYKLVEA